MITARWRAVWRGHIYRIIILDLGGIYVCEMRFVFECGSHLSLVVLYVEEGVIVRQFDHLEGMISGFMNDGQVEKPVCRGGGEKKKQVS